MCRHLLALLLLLAGCGDLPRPYQGAPGATAMRLARPPAARIAVVPGPATAGEGANVMEGPGGPYAQAVAQALQAREIPAVADTARPGDWALLLRATVNGAMAVPSFTLVDPAGGEQGSEQAAPVPLGLWRQGQEGVLKKTAEDAAPRIATLLARVEAARRQSDPRSLTNTPGRTAVTDVTGAPGDGNIVLARLMRERLGVLGQVVQESTIGTDFTVKAVVTDAPVNARTRRVEIVWVVYNARNVEVGRITQANDVPAGALDRHWGDVAVVVAEEAATAIRDLILTQTNRH